jgi:hypothetical protein
VLLRKGITVFVLVALLITAAMVSATAAKPDSKKSTIADSLIIVSAYDMPQSTQMSASAVYATASVFTIRQGQTNWHGKYISQGCPGYVCDLNWGNSANSLQLRIYCADGSIKGPVYDSADGRIDGRINIYVYSPAGLPGGTYYHEVYGYRVSGVEDYTF